jgi:hypothetical protein
VLSEQQKHTAAVAAERRRAVLQLVAQGWSLARIGEQLGISKQRVAALLRRGPARNWKRGGLERCPHCGLVAKAGTVYRPGQTMPCASCSRICSQLRRQRGAA